MNPIWLSQLHHYWHDHNYVQISRMSWGTLALVNAGLAQGKGRSGLNWFLLSLFLGPLATFLLVAMFDRLPVSK